MKRKHGLALCMIFCIGAAVCQGQGSPKKIWFRSINAVGLLNGEESAAAQFQTVNGIQYKSWFAGAGAGLDYYRFRSIPIFLDFRKEFGRSKRMFFIYGDWGYASPWLTDKEKDNFQTYKNAGGLYTDAGFGFSYKIGPRTSVFISAGYSCKSMKQKTQPSDIEWPVIGPLYSSAGNSGDYVYSMNRLTLKTGLSF